MKIPDILVFTGRMVSVKTVQHCSHSMKATIDDKKMNGHSATVYKHKWQARLRSQSTVCLNIKSRHGYKQLEFLHTADGNIKWYCHFGK